ncbi:hypothetical protein AYO21_03817 [Fonsecaea monophora]|uniref:Azaphilone pigments biosynthesis cluster protein L N-terminal domain-containing protein n=1 Tax=Fonsecaea monophora TaxID=254056 RepID=A0A177FF35_9EURO|nr:hypothetical protein AYO21_03817 [Fonsecaea monophora]KAH0828262.1 hsp70 family chaperone [Fonsecaea pedrosoi]OAG42082.1 hypothetical protein AYO21_03817 [Fonsecaea monophora]
MDPISITTACVGTIAAVAQLSAQANGFASRFKDARNDMQELLQELASLSASLESMRDDGNMAKYPASLRQNLLDTLRNCDDVTTQMGELLRKLSSTGLFGRLKWSLSKREKLMNLKSKLEGHKSAIAIALLIASIFVSMETKDNTHKILNDTTVMRRETAQITTLYQWMGSLQLFIRDLRSHGDAAEGNMFQSTVDSTTTYTAAFVDRDPSGRFRASDEFFDALEYPEAALVADLRAMRLSRSSQPDLVIAVDFGTTYTGVGWWDTKGTPGETLNILRRWPGTGFASEDKVPTALAYRNGELLSWGFPAIRETDDHDTQIFDAFKAFLDPCVLQTASSLWRGSRRVPEDPDHARKLCLDFLRMLYAHIEEGFAGMVHGWHHKEIEFIFAIPSAWNVNVMQSFEALVDKAGFGRAGRQHSCQLSMTEAEATVISALSHSTVPLTPQGVVLVADLGGISTKISFLESTAGSGQGQRFQVLHQAEDYSLGSAMIDVGFQRLAFERLRYLEAELGLSRTSIKDAVRKMTIGLFQTYKTTFETSAIILLRLPVPGLPTDFNSKEAKVERGCFILDRNELQRLFDDQLNRIFQLINDQIARALRVLPRSPIAHIVLSGGLGRSPYVIHKFGNIYRHLDPSPFIMPAAGVVQLPDPQLAVVRGLLMSRAHQLAVDRLGAGSRPVLRARVARISYGIVYNQLFNPHMHRDQNIFRDETDRRVYARDQIKWLVVAGTSLDDDKNLIEIPMVHAVSMMKPIETWSHAIVMAPLGGNRVLSKLTTVTNLTCNFTDAPAKVFREPESATYLEVRYKIAVIFQPQLVIFEVRVGGKAYSRATHEIQWTSSTE